MSEPKYFWPDNLTGASREIICSPDMGCWINQSLHTYKYLRHKINDISANSSFSQANIHSIMDAEPQVESLMQLLNDALKELDHLDTRLTGYDTLLRVSSWELIPSSCIQHGWNLTLLLFCQHDNVNYSVNAIAMIGPLVSMAYTTLLVAPCLKCMWHEMFY